MEICRKQQQWPANLISLNDSEFDLLIDHALTCKYHDEILLKYENSFLPYLKAAFALSDEDKLRAVVNAGQPIPYIMPAADADELRTKHIFNWQDEKIAFEGLYFKKLEISSRDIGAVISVFLLMVGICFFQVFSKDIISLDKTQNPATSAKEDMKKLSASSLFK